MVYPYHQQQYPYQYQQRNQLRIIPVSNIMEANSTPVDGFEPMFFYNRAENVIYMKQLNQTGAAPIQVFKLETQQETPVNPYENDFKLITEKIDGLYSLLSEDDKKGKK